jgi:hypothetical protein
VKRGVSQMAVKEEVVAPPPQVERNYELQWASTAAGGVRFWLTARFGLVWQSEVVLLVAEVEKEGQCLVVWGSV